VEECLDKDNAELTNIANGTGKHRKALSREAGYSREIASADAQELVHKLQAHQAELELKNRELRRIKAELERSRDKYLDLYDFAPVGYITLDKYFLVLEVNLTATAMLRAERQSLIKTSFSQFVTPESRDDSLLHFRNVFETETEEYCELKILRKDGTTFYAQLQSVAVPDDEGNLSQCRTAILDITENRQAEENMQAALRETLQHQAEVTALLEGSRAVLEYHEFHVAARAIFDSCKNLLGAASGYVALLNVALTENEVLFLDSGGLPCAVDPTLRMPVRGLRAEVYRTGKAMYCNDFSQSKWVEYMPEGHAPLDNVLFIPLVIRRNVVGLLGVANKPGGFNDNDARIATAFGELAAVALHNSRAMESLEESEERCRHVVQTAGDAIITVNRKGQIASWNRAAEIIFGYSAGEVLGRSVTLVIPKLLLKAHRLAFRRAVAKGELSNVQKTRELTGLRKGGSEFPLELSLATLKTRKELLFSSIIRDISERKRLDQLKDEFIGLVSHELRTPLTVVIGAIKTVLSEEEQLTQEEIRQLLNDAAWESEYLSHLLGNLLELSRSQAGRLLLHAEPLDVKKVARDAIAAVKPLSPSHNFVVEFPPKLPRVPADQLRLQRILHNLLENAVKYSPEGSDVHIFARLDEEYLVIGVSNQGEGISRENQAKLFAPFQRLEDAVRSGIKGTGLGLRVCQTLVEAHGGKIWVESEPDRGSTFFFTLPSRHRGKRDS
jgi:PAS domain S-box-containing protein